MIKADPTFIRVFGIAERSSGEPGYASEPVDFLAVRDPLDWSLPPVWGLASARGETPIISRRLLEYTEHTSLGAGRFDLEGVTHVVTGPRHRQAEAASTAPARRRARPSSSGTPRPSPGPPGGPAVYAAGRAEAVAALDPARGRRSASDLVVEDPDRPLPDRRRGPGHRPDHPRTARARRGRGRRGDPGVSRPRRHVRPRLVGDPRRPPVPIRPA